MKSPAQSQERLHAQLAVLRRVAPTTFVALCAVVLASLVVATPSVGFALGSSMAGVFVSAAWLTAERGRSGGALAFGLLAISCALLSAASAIAASLPLPLALAQGLGITGATFFLCLAAEGLTRRSSGLPSAAAELDR